MRARLRPFWCPIPLLLLASIAAGAQAPNPATINPSVTIRAKSPQAGPPLPKLPPDQFIDCIVKFSGDLVNLTACQQEMNWDKDIVVDACLDRDGKQAPPRVIQACTESLAHDIVQGKRRLFLFASRGAAYFASGESQLALDDYDAAIKLDPDNAELLYDRGVVLAKQPDDDAALRDFDAAIRIDPKLLPALRQRAKIYGAQGKFSGALADYSAAIQLQPKDGALWSERGYVALCQHEYEDAMKDEARAIQLDPKLARAYFLRSLAFVDLGERASAVSDLQTAVGLDSSLARYVTIKGKTVSLALPPL